jgi:hypothetical protein
VHRLRGPDAEGPKRNWAVWLPEEESIVIGHRRPAMDRGARG